MVWVVIPMVLFLVLRLGGNFGASERPSEPALAPQPPIPTLYFRSPLGIPLLLAGNFAEMRTGHFHSGIDIKTNNRPGYRVYAAADGWVSRIKVSPTGYGQALYVDHPNGYTTVYAHLSRFKEDLAAYVKKKQYAEHSFALDMSVSKGMFPLKKGEVIAFSGNTGSSSGPHLHFEIRDTASEEPMNPLLFGIPVTDHERPRIYRVKVYAANRESGATIVHSDGSRPIRATFDAPVVIGVVKGKSGYRLKNVKAIRARGEIGFGIQASDFHDGSKSRLGAYRIALLADADTLYRSQMRRFNFSQTRFINAHVDYAERLRNHRWIQRSFLLPGNRLPLYKTAHSGWLSVRPGGSHAMRYRIDDAAGNHSTLDFDVVGDAEHIAATNGHRVPDAFIPRTRETTFERDGLRIIFPAYALYEDLELHVSIAAGDANTFSPRYRIQDPFTPVQKRFRLSLDARGVPPRLRKRALIAYRDEDGDVSSVGGVYNAGRITANPRAFGTYYIAADTVAPVVRPVNIRDGKDMSRLNSIKINMRDALAGIDSYAGFVDDQWVLFTYDSKRNRLEYVFDGHVSKGRHRLSVVVTDQVGNVGRYEAHFSR